MFCSNNIITIERNRSTPRPIETHAPRNTLLQVTPPADDQIDRFPFLLMHRQHSLSFPHTPTPTATVITSRRISGCVCVCIAVDAPYDREGGKKSNSCSEVFLKGGRKTEHGYVKISRLADELSESGGGCSSCSVVSCRPQATIYATGAWANEQRA
jgi:hypothetical protein